MSLVAYGSSDESDGEEPVPAIESTRSTVTNTTSSGSAIEKLKSIASTSKGTIQIVAPSLAEIEDSSSEEDEPKLKVKNPSTFGSGLKAILPPVKSSSTVKINSLIPDSVKRRKPPPSLPPPKRVLAQNTIKDVTADDEDDFDGQFFSIDEPGRQNEQVIRGTNIQIAPDIAPEAPIVNTRVVDEDTERVVQQPAMSELQYKKVIASKFGESSADNITIMDINVNDHLSQNREYIKTVSMETDDPEKAGEAPNPTVRRKNHILSLAHQAKQRELALKNEWAQNKVAKNQTRAKYGF